MHPAQRVAAGLGLAGLALLANRAQGLAAGFQDYMVADVVLALGLLVAAGGAAGLRAGHGHGHGALAAGLALATLGGVMGIGFTLAWDGRTALYVAGDLLPPLGLAQATWFAVLVASRPSQAAQRAFGLRAGLALAAGGLLLVVAGDLLDGVYVNGSLRIVALAGLGLALRAPPSWLRGDPAAGAPPQA